MRIFLNNISQPVKSEGSNLVFFFVFYGHKLLYLLILENRPWFCNTVLLWDIYVQGWYHFKAKLLFSLWDWLICFLGNFRQPFAYNWSLYLDSKRKTVTHSNLKSFLLCFSAQRRLSRISVSSCEAFILERPHPK